MRFCFALLVASGLAACAPAGEFPSLASRPGEGTTSTEPVVRPPVAVASDPALLARIAGLRGQVAEGDQAFQAAVGGTAAAANRAGASGSESWVEAQLLLSRLEAARRSSLVALADLDALRLARAQQPTFVGDFAALEAALLEASETVARQQERIDSIRARLAR